MDNKQKRTFMSLIYRTITFVSLVAIGLIAYLIIDKLYTGVASIMWLDITLLSICAFVLIFILADSISTRKLTSKYAIAKFYYFIFVSTIVGAIVLGAYIYISKFDFMSYISYALPLGLLLLTEMILIVNFIVGMTLSRLHKNSTITLDSVSDTPNFDDEIILKKKLDELNRKLEMKKVQEQISSVEKQLDDIK